MSGNVVKETKDNKEGKSKSNAENMDQNRTASDDNKTEDVMVVETSDDTPLNEIGFAEVANFIHSKNHVRTIAPISDSQAWIYEYNAQEIGCVDISGQVSTNRKLSTYMTDFTLLENNDIVYTVFGGKTVRRLSQSGEIQTICSTSPLYPTGVCRAYDGGLLVGLVDCNVQEITTDTRGKVYHMTLSGKIIRKYKRSQDGKRKLFINPNRVAQNINKDICVIDYLDKCFTSRLVVVSVIGKVKVVYGGQPTLERRFVSDDVCCDKDGRILVTDVDNHAVHRLSPDGDFLQLLLTKQDLPQAPRSLALYDDNLWVGCYDGAVKVFKETSLFIYKL